jgi:hypothetical protein
MPRPQMVSFPSGHLAEVGPFNILIPMAVFTLSYRLADGRVINKISLLKFRSILLITYSWKK